MLALGLYSGRVMMVDEATGMEKWAVQAHSATDLRTRVAMSPGNGSFVASVGVDDEHWKLWDAANGDLHSVGATHDGTGACICEVNVLGQRVLQEECPVVAHIWGISAVTFSPCGQRLATGGHEGAVIVWDAQTGQAAHRMQRAGRLLAGPLSFSADGARLASVIGARSIHIWDVTTGAVVRTIPGAHFNAVHSIQFSPTDSRTLASAGCDLLILLWDVDSGEIIESIAGHGLAVFSRDGRSIATSEVIVAILGGGVPNRRSEVHLVDAESGALRSRIVGHNEAIRSAAFSVDGSKLASGSNDGTCKVWDSSTGALLLTINVGAPVSSVSFGRDWVRDTQGAMAFAMGQHPRLGAGSQVLELEVGVVLMILDLV